VVAFYELLFIILKMAVGHSFRYTKLCFSKVVVAVKIVPFTASPALYIDMAAAIFIKLKLKKCKAVIQD